MRFLAKFISVAFIYTLCAVTFSSCSEKSNEIPTYNNKEVYLTSNIITPLKNITMEATTSNNQIEGTFNLPSSNKFNYTFNPIEKFRINGLKPLFNNLIIDAYNNLEK